MAFRAQVGGEVFRCGGRYASVGTPPVAVEPTDLRLYVSDLELLRPGGEAVPVRLVPDGRFQDDTVALLDFEDNSGFCRAGTAAIHTEVRGHVDGGGPFAGLRFRIGVPKEKNFVDLAKAKAPLNRPELFWSWTDGYIFLRASFRSAARESTALWLGAAPYDVRGCAGSCTDDPRPVAVVDGFDPARDVVVLDVGQLFAGASFGASPLAADGGAEAAGCFMEHHAGTCEPILAPLGIDWARRVPPEAGRVAIVRRQER